MGTTSSPINLYNILVVLTVALGSFNYGFSSAVIGSIFGLPGFFSYYDLTLSGADSAAIIGAANGLFAGGGLIGCILLICLSDKLSRVRVMQMICFISIVSSILQAASVHRAMLLVGRFVSGMGAGMSNATIPVYQSEISPAKSRGKFVTSHGVFLVLGYSAAGWAGYGCYFLTDAPQVAWRLCFALQAFAPVILLVATPWVPESPRWLVLKERNEEALQVLNRLHHRSGDEDNQFALDEYNQICLQLEVEARHHTTLWQGLKKKSNRKRLFTGMFVQMLAQSTGILVVNNYQVLLWNSLGLYGSIPLLLYGVWLTYACSLNVFTGFIVDRFGRIKLLAIGLGGGVIMLSIYTALFVHYGGTDNKAGNIACVVVLFMWLTCYAAFIDSTSYIYCSEIFPTQLRTQGVGFCIAGFFAITLLYTQVAATAFAQIGWKFYLVFIIVPACGLPVLMRFPETKGLSLEEICVVFGDIEDAVLDANSREQHEIKCSVQTIERIEQAGSV